MVDTVTSNTITQYDHFFAEIKPYFSIDSDPDEHGKKFLKKWMRLAEKYLTAPLFLRKEFIHFLSAFEKIVQNPYVYEVIKGCDDMEDGQTYLGYILEVLLEESEKSFKYYNGNELVIIFQHFSKISTSLPDNWLEQWYKQSADKMDDFTCKDFFFSLLAHVSLNVKPTEQWLKRWFALCCQNGWQGNSYEFAQLIFFLQKMHVQIDAVWLERWIKLAPAILLSETHICNILHSFDLLDLPIIRANHIFIKALLEKCIEVLTDLECNQLLHIFQAVMKSDLPIPHTWLSELAKCFTPFFNNLHIHKSIHILYHFACTQVKPENIRSFLETYKSFLRKNNHKLSKEKPLAIKELFLAVRYFRLKGFDLGINDRDLVALMDFFKQSKHISCDKKTIFYSILKTKTRVGMDQDAWIDGIFKTVDIYLPSKRIVIMIYGINDYIDGETLKARHQLTHLLLENDEYTVLMYKANDENNSPELFFENILKPHLGEE